jgi:hypothetical protein
LCGKRGRVFKKFESKFQQIGFNSKWHTLDLTRKDFNEFLTKGSAVVRLTWARRSTRELPDGERVSGFPGFPADLAQHGNETGSDELWAHVALHYKKPWRPTFSVLMRAEEQPEHVAGIIDLVFTREEARRKQRLRVRTLHELLGMVDIKTPVKISWFQMLGRQSRTVDRVLPFRLKVRGVIDPEEFWKGKAAETIQRRGSLVHSVARLRPAVFLHVRSM